MSDTANTTNNTQEIGAGAVVNAVTTPPSVEASPPQSAEAVAGTSPSTDKKKTPKRPRRSFIERAQEESEELVRTMGGSLELEGGRRTRSSTRGTPRSTPVVTPPPSKKGRTSPTSALTTTQKTGRNRARKNIAAAIDEPEPPVQKDDEEQKEEDEEEAALASNVEKKVEEPKAAAAKSKNETASVEESKVNTDNSSEKATVQSEDKTDAVGDLKSIPEELQNNIDHIVADSSENETESEQQTETKTTKEVSSKSKIQPMEVDEDIEEVKASAEVEKKSETITTKTEEKSTPPVAPVIVVTPAAPVAVDDEEEVTKEPTPEAMEVDSVSKSNNATVEPKLVESNKPANEVVATTTTTAAAVPTPSVNEIKETTSITEPAKIDSAPIVIANNATKTETNKVESIPPPPPPTPSAQNIIGVEKNNTPLAEIASKNVEHNLSNSTETATPIVDASKADEPAANIISSPIKKPNVTEQSSEPTIKSPTETSDNTTNVSTPQVCN